MVTETSSSNPFIDPQRRSERLNHGCSCTTLDRGRLAKALDHQVGDSGFAEQLTASHPTLVSNVPVFVPGELLTQMMRVVGAYEAAARSPIFIAAALSHAPPVAKHDFGPAGVFMGYDFHLTLDGPKLIEVNSNAGGAFLNAPLARAQRSCCGIFHALPELEGSFEGKVAAMFLEEWRRQRGLGTPGLIAIVDDAPEQQYLFPEFRLAKAALERQGFETRIADPQKFRFEGERLWLGEHPVDLVYNRLVDFSLEEPRHAALCTAYLGGRVVVTPNPHVHAVLADKRNLVLLSDAEFRESCGLAPDHSAALEHGLLKTVPVSSDNADALWRDRRSYFFKPARGHGSKAAYRGDKLTRNAWTTITAGDYVAQAFAPPSTRRFSREGDRVDLKIDVRLYTYDGALLLPAARLYQGQTTNMRTPGGGFAPVLTDLTTSLSGRLDR